MNPDGNERAYNEVINKGKSYAAAKFDTLGRENARNVDLNRDFPDHFHPKPGGPEATETRNVITFMKVMLSFTMITDNTKF